MILHKYTLYCQFLKIKMQRPYEVLLNVIAFENLDSLDSVGFFVCFELCLL